MPKTAKAKRPKVNQSVEPSYPAQAGEFLPSVVGILAQYGIEASANDSLLLATALTDIAHLKAAHWDHLKEAANEAGEGEIIAKLEVVLPFGTSEPTVQTKISFTCKKITDQRETKLEDPNQTKLALEGKSE